MLSPRVIPILLLKNGGLWKGVKFSNHKYVGDPINAVKIFNEKAVDELIFLDITASREHRGPNFELIEQIASECFMPLTYGGGIQNFDDVKRLFSLGVEKVAINTGVLLKPALIRQIVESYGSQSLVVSVDVKKNIFGGYQLYSYSGAEKNPSSPFDWVKQAEALGAGEILLSSIDRDGTLLGYDLALIEKVASSVTIPTVVAGGAASLTDFKKAVKVGASGVAAGSMFVFYGKHRAVLIQYPTAKEIEDKWVDK